MKEIGEIFVNWEKLILRDGAELFIKDKTSNEKYDNLISTLNNIGYKTEIERYEGDVRFSFMKKGEETLYASYIPRENRIRIILKQNGELYLKNEYVSSEKTSPLITQVRPIYFSVDCGMCYIIRLSDGKFVLIDSSFGEYEDSEHIFEILKEQSPKFEKPVIAAWFLSHAHDDHFGGFVSFIKKYNEHIYLENVIYNWEKIGNSDITDFEKTIELIKKDTRIIIARTGQRFCFTDCVFDLLFTGEDLYPQEIYNLNDTSLVMRMDLSGHKVLWLGDAMEQSSDYICSKYDDKTFKCDFLQVGHHGYAGGSEELYKWANPEILLWSCPDFWYPVVKEWKPNEVLLNSNNVRQNLIAGQQEIVIDLTKTIPDFKPYKSFKKGEVIYYQNFKNKKVIELGWSCITGGNTGYAPLDIFIKDQECILTANDSFSVCELVQLGQIQANPDFTFKISGVLESNTGEVGMFWNYNQPTVFNEDKVIWFETTKDGKFEYTFSSDFSKKQMILYFYDKAIGEFSYDEAFALCFIMKNCCVKLKELQLISGVKE